MISFTYGSFPFQVFIAPPLFRRQPAWYNNGLTQIAARFSTVFTSHQQPNLHLLPSFSSQDLLPDGKFLTPVSGLHYVLHIFDQTEMLMTRATLTNESQLAQVQEQVRHHEDRMSYLENRHVGLQLQADSKIAADAEFDDWTRNRSEEDWIVIKGLPQLANVTRQEWPMAVKRQVSEAIKLVLHANRSRLDFEVLHVFNPFRPDATGPTTYNVRMDSVYTAKKLREMFSGFFRHHRPLSRPPALKGVSFRNKITLETKIRIEILRQLGSVYKASNPGSTFDVRGYDPRPVLVTVPPRSASARQRTFNFVQAATTLPANFSDEHLTRIFQVIGDRFRGKLKSLFIVLNDDDHDRCLELVKAADSQRRSRRVHFSASGGAPASASGSVSDAITSFAQISGPGSGMDVESQLSRSLLDPPPPPPVSDSFPLETESSRAHDERVRQRRREHQRQPTPEGDRRGLKRSRQSSYSDSDSRSKKSRKSRKHKRSRGSRRSRRSPTESSSSRSSSDADRHRSRSPEKSK